MRLIDADALERDFPIRIGHYDKEHGNIHFVFGIESVLEYVNEMPTIDAVEVVHCKDCKSCWVHEPTNTHFCFLRDKIFRTMPTDFCNYGERK